MGKMFFQHWYWCDKLTIFALLKFSGILLMAPVLAEAAMIYTERRNNNKVLFYSQILRNHLLINQGILLFLFGNLVDEYYSSLCGNDTWVSTNTPISSVSPKESEIILTWDLVIKSSHSPKFNTSVDITVLHPLAIQQAMLWWPTDTCWGAEPSGRRFGSIQQKGIKSAVQDIVSILNYNLKMLIGRIWPSPD